MLGSGMDLWPSQLFHIRRRLAFSARAAGHSSPAPSQLRPGEFRSGNSLSQQSAFCLLAVWFWRCSAAGGQVVGGCGVVAGGPLKPRSVAALRSRDLSLAASIGSPSVIVSISSSWNSGSTSAKISSAMVSGVTGIGSVRPRSVKNMTAHSDCPNR